MKEKQKKPHRFLWWLFGFVSAIIVTAATVAFLPVKYYFGGKTDGMIADDIANGGLLDVLMHYREYTVGDFPVVESLITQAMKDNRLDGFFSIDYSSLNDVLLTDNDIGSKVKSSVKITASLRSIGDYIGKSDLLGPFSSLSVFQDWTPVTETPDPTSPSFNASLYYWQENDKYTRAFDTEGKPVAGVTLGETPLVYPALMDIPLLEVMPVAKDRFGMAKTIDIVKAAGLGDETSIAGKIVKDRSLSDMASFSVDSILLSDIVTPDDSNDSFYRVLLSGCQPEDGTALTKETLTIGNIKNMNINKAHLVDILTETEENQKVIQIIVDATGKSTYAEVAIGDLNSIDVNQIKLSGFLTESDSNETLVNLLKEATGKSEYSSITIGDLSTADFQKVKLSSFLKATTANQNALDAFASGCGKASYEEATIGDLDVWNGDAVRLNSLFPESENKDLYPLLRDLSGKATGDLLVGDLKGLDPKKLHLKTVLPVDENQSLYDLLTDMVGDGTKTSETIQLNDLSSFDANKLHLVKVLPNNSVNANLYQILADATGKDAASLRVSDLSGFDSGKIHLSSVLSESGNETLYQVLSDALGMESSTMTLADLSLFNASNVKLSSVFALTGHESFYQLLSEATGKTASDILVGDLNAFDAKQIRLASVLDPAANEKLYDLLCEATTRADGSVLTSDTIKIGDLSRFDPSNIHLKTVLNDGGDNPFLKALIAKDATIGNLAFTLDALPLVDLYGDKCFQEEPGDSNGWNADPYQRTLDTNGRYVYTLAEGVTPSAGDEYYYVASNASVWLLFCYDATLPSDTSNAVPTTYTPSSLTLSDWEDGAVISSAITEATLYEVYASHLVNASKAKSEYPALALRKTLGEVLNAL